MAATVIAAAESRAANKHPGLISWVDFPTGSHRGVGGDLTHSLAAAIGRLSPSQLHGQQEPPPGHSHLPHPFSYQPSSNSARTVPQTILFEQSNQLGKRTGEG